MSKSINKIQLWLKDYLLLLTALIVFLLITYLIWKYCESYKDIGSNLFAGAIQTIFTLFVLDRLITKSNERNKLPMQVAAYEDTRLFVSRIISLFQSLYSCTVLDEQPTTIDNFFSEEVFEKIFRNCNLATIAPVVPSRTWFYWLPESIKDIITLGEKTLERNSDKLPPEVFGAVHAITTGSFFHSMSLINICYMNDRNNNIPRPSVLTCYTISPTYDDLQNIVFLFKWTQKFYIKNYERYPLLKKVGEIYKNPIKSEPKSMITQAELNRQIQNFEEWRKRSI